jgi:4'-phosphopantetheinyl transferase
MPLVRQEIISEACCWALWEIRETADELLEMLQPAPPDWEQLRQISHEHKRLEWLASRLTARKLLESIGTEYRGIDKNSNNKPSLRDCPFHISLSHTGQYGAAILHQTRKVGIDIEYTKEKIQRIKHKFLSVKELTEAGHTLEELTVYWCAKEALYKIYDQRQLIFSEHIRIEPFSVETSGKIKGQIAKDLSVQDYEITYLKLDPLTIAYAY